MRCHLTVAMKKKKKLLKLFQKRTRRKKSKKMKNRKLTQMTMNWSVYTAWVEIITKTLKLSPKQSKERKPLPISTIKI